MQEKYNHGNVKRRESHEHPEVKTPNPNGTSAVPASLNGSTLNMIHY